MICSQLSRGYFLIPDRLFYYCDSSTFLSLIKPDRKLWLTDLTRSNDRAKGRWALNRYLDLIMDAPTERRGAKLVLEFELELRTALGMCFSEECDLLSQWRGYADEGRGFCMGFSLSGLQEMIQGHPHLELCKVSYGCMAEEGLPDEIQAAFKSEFKKYSENTDNYGCISSSFAIDNFPRIRD